MHFVLVNNKRNRAEVLEHSKQYDNAQEQLCGVIPLHNLILLNEDGTFLTLSRSHTFNFNNGYLDFNSLDAVLATQVIKDNRAKSLYLSSFFSREAPKDLDSACTLLVDVEVAHVSNY